MFVRQNRPLRPFLGDNTVPGEIIADDAQGFDHDLTVAVDSPAGTNRARLRVRLPHPVYLRLGLAVGQRHLLALKANTIHVFQR